MPRRTTLLISIAGLMLSASTTLAGPEKDKERDQRRQRQHENTRDNQRDNKRDSARYTQRLRKHANNKADLRRQRPQPLDIDRDGIISDTERAAAKARIIDHILSTVPPHVDTNHDGQIDGAELAAINAKIDDRLARAQSGERPLRQRDGRRDRKRDRKQGRRNISRQQLLEKFDANNDGTLDEAERDHAHKALRDRDTGNQLRRNAPPPRFTRDDFIKKFDANNDGTLDESERQAAHQAMKGLKDKRRRVRVAHQVDADQSGDISPDELARTLERINQHDQDLDINRDGITDAEDARALVERIERYNARKKH